MAGGMKRLAKETAIYGLSSIVGRFLNWMLVPMYTRVLANTNEFGVVTNLYGWTALLLVILTYGMETGFFRFVNKQEEREPMRVYATALYSVGFTSALFMVAAWLLLGPISGALGYAAHPEYVGMMAGIVAVDAFCCLPFAYLRYRNKAVRFAAIKLANIFLNIALNIFFLVVCPRLNESHPEWIAWFYRPGYGIGYIFLTNVFTTITTLLMLLPDMMPGLRARPDAARLRQMLAYSFPILILSIAGIFNQTADKILFPLLFEDSRAAHTQLGIYGACYKLAVVMVLFTQAFRYAYDPFIFAEKKKGEEAARSAYSSAMTYYVLFTYFIFLVVMAYMEILKLLIEPTYYPGLVVVPWIMAGQLMFGIYFNLSLWYKVTDRTHWGTILSIFGCVLTVAIIVLLAPRYGFMACAWASVVANGGVMLVSYFLGQHYYPVQYQLKKLMGYTLLTALLYGMMTFGATSFAGSPLLQLSINSLLLLLFVGIVLRLEVPRSAISMLRQKLHRR